MTARDHLTVADARAISDVERDRVVRELTRHCGDGRLTLDELEHRITEAYAATTQAELAHAMRELPASTTVVATTSGPPVRVHHADPARKEAARRAGEIALRIHALVYLAVIGLLVMIWAMTSFGGYFWPMWTAMPWGFALGIHAGIHKIANS